MYKPKRAHSVPEAEARDVLREQLFKRAEAIARVYQLDDSDVVEVLQDLVGWYANTAVVTVDTHEACEAGG